MATHHHPIGLDAGAVEADDDRTVAVALVVWIRLVIFTRMGNLGKVVSLLVYGSEWVKILERNRLMVGAEGFEPPTLWSQTRCATRLRYAPTIV